MSNRAHTLLLTALLVSGCDGTPVGPDASAPRDARVEEGGLLDAGAPAFDASPVRDAARDGGAPLCVWTACDPRSPDGCMASESCVLRAETASCEPDPGSLGRDAPCTSVSECAPGLACFLVEGSGRCSRLCCPDDGSACTDGASCGGSGMLVDGTATSWGRCLARRACDVHAASDVCEAREGCYIVDAFGTTECRVAGTASSGEPCDVQENCRPGFFCGGVGGTSRRCVRICRIGESDCAAGESCVAQAHTPSGSGLCSVDGAAARAR